MCAWAGFRRIFRERDTSGGRCSGFRSTLVLNRTELLALGTRKEGYMDESSCSDAGAVYFLLEISPMWSGRWRASPGLVS